MRLGYVEESGFDWSVKGKVEGSGGDAAGQCAAEGLLQVTRAKRQEGLGIGKEKVRGEFVLSAAEFAVPVGRELVVVIAARLANRESAGTWNQETVRAVELIALELQQFYCDGIQPGNTRGEPTGEEGGDEVRFAAGRRQHRNRGADKSARRETAALPRALIVEKEKAVFFCADGPAHAATKNVLLYGWARLAIAVQEVLIGIEHVVAEELVHVAVKILGARFEDGVDVAAAVAALAGVVQRSLHLEFLNHIGIGQWYVSGLRYVVVRGADAFNQKIVVVFALAIHEEFHAAASQLCGGVQFALGAGG